MKRLVLSLSMGAAALSLVACGGDDDDNKGGLTEAQWQAKLQTYKPTLKATVDGVIVPIYKDLMDKAAKLKEAVDAIDAAAPTAKQLEDAQKAWVAARVPWEASEAFLFGPVADLSLDPQLDSWPVDHGGMDQQIEGTTPFKTADLSGAYAGGLRGFHTIEYLLFGKDKGRKAEDFTAAPAEDPDKGKRTLEYLKAITLVLGNDTTRLWRSYQPEATCTEDDTDTKGECLNFGARFIGSGAPGGVHYSTKDAMETLVGGMLDIVGEVGTEKIAAAYKPTAKEGDTTLVESQYSYNSLDDFQDNIRSVKYIYSGMGDAEGPFMQDYVKKQDADLDAEITKAIDASIKAIAAISKDGTPFRTYVKDHSDRADPAKVGGRTDTALAELKKLEAALNKVSFK